MSLFHTGQYILKSLSMTTQGAYGLHNSALKNTTMQTLIMVSNCHRCEGIGAACYCVAMFHAILPVVILFVIKQLNIASGYFCIELLTFLNTYLHDLTFDMALEAGKTVWKQCIRIEAVGYLVNASKVSFSIQGLVEKQLFQEECLV